MIILFVLFVIFEIVSIITFIKVDADNEWDSAKVKEYRANYKKGCNNEEMEPVKSLQNASLNGCGYFTAYVI